MVEACAIGMGDVEWYQMAKWENVGNGDLSASGRRAIRTADNILAINTDSFYESIRALSIKVSAGSVLPIDICELVLAWDPTTTILEIKSPSCPQLPDSIVTLVEGDPIAHDGSHAKPPRKWTTEMALRGQGAILPLAHGLFQVKHDGDATFANSRNCIDHPSCEGIRLILGEDGEGVIWMWFE